MTTDITMKATKIYFHCGPFRYNIYIKIIKIKNHVEKRLKALKKNLDNGLKKTD